MDERSISVVIVSNISLLFIGKYGLHLDKDVVKAQTVGFVVNANKLLQISH